MKKKYVMLFSVMLALSIIFTGCGIGTSGNSSENASPAEGYDVLGGQLWEVGGLYFNGQIYDIQDNENLASLYGSTYLSFGSDGTFEYINLFHTEGLYEPYDRDGANDSYLLKVKRSLKFDSDKGEYVEAESSKKTYLVTVLDSNTLEYVEFDAVTGDAKAGENPIIFVKSDKDSTFLQNNKSDISGNSGSSSEGLGNSKVNAYNNLYGDHDSSSYQGILDEYTDKMESAVPGLVSEYLSAASGISDVNRLADICNDKVGELANICNEGVGKMASLMNSKGDSYSTYESWAEKLMDKYTDIAQEIMDAYIDSAS